jgi:hypothetical protein
VCVCVCVCVGRGVRFIAASSTVRGVFSLIVRGRFIKIATYNFHFHFVRQLSKVSSSSLTLLNLSCFYVSIFLSHAYTTQGKMYVT